MPLDLVLACLASTTCTPPTDATGLREAARGLRPNGRLVVIDIAGTKTYTATARAARDPCATLKGDSGWIPASW